MALPPNLERLTSALDTRRLAATLNAHPVTTISTVGLALALPFAINDYRIFKSYGPNGVPNNIFGWLFTTLLRSISREQHSLSVYQDKKLPFSEEPGYLPAEFPPRRRSERPKLGPHPVPQRQLDQLPPADVRQKLVDRFAELGAKAERMGLIEVRQSMFERHNKAFIVSKSREWHAVARQTRGETAHVHAAVDGSVHVVLHPKDCSKLFERGWAQRHALSGAESLKYVMGASIPVNYVLVYAPRDEGELEIVTSILKAAIQFMAGTREPLD